MLAAVRCPSTLWAFWPLEIRMLEIRMLVGGGPGNERVWAADKMLFFIQTEGALKLYLSLMTL